MDGVAGVEDGDGPCPAVDLRGPGGGLAATQGDAGLVRGHAVEGGAVQAGEAFQPVEGTLVVKDLGEDRQGVGGGEAAGTAAGVFLQRIRMGC